MVLLTSEPTNADFTAPDFTLLEPKTGDQKTLKSVQGTAATVVCFICNHCPYVVYVNPMLRQLATEFADQGVKFVGINANDAAAYPADAPEKMAVVDYPFPYLYDETQATARAYGAVCTPDFFVFGGDMQLAYRGRLCAGSPGNLRRLTGDEMRAALSAIVSKNPVPQGKPSMGCSIKWK